MENLLIQKTQSSPEINFNKTGNLLIKGVSNTNDAKKIYGPAIEWVKNFKTLKPAKVNLTLEMHYLNTSSTLAMVEFLKELWTLKALGSKLEINWCYEEDDEDMLDVGEDLRSSCNCEFKFTVID